MELFRLLGTIAVDNADAVRSLNETGEAGEKAESKLGKAFGAVGKGAVAVGKTIGKAMVAGGAAVAGLAASAINSYADYEQLVGGVETLFGAGGMSVEEYAKSVGKSVAEASAEYDSLMSAQGKVFEYAENAYKTAGMSANEYMETVTGFSAALISSLGGDTEAAAEKANLALTDMSDNANKMGSDMESIKNAYSGFAKQNYTMLDNLKLGYGGTKEEMQRLLDDAMALSGVEYDISSYADVVDAIHVIQTEMGITGTTAKEASSTISGSIGMMKSSWGNMLNAIASDDLPFDEYVNNFVDSVTAVTENLIPRITVALNGVVKLIEQLAPVIIGKIPELFSTLLPSVITAATGLIRSLVAIVPDLVDMIVGILPSLIDAFVDIFRGVVQALPKIITTLTSAIPTLVPLIVEALFNMVEILLAYIPDMIQPILEFLPTMWTTVTEALVEYAPYLIAAAFDMIGILIPMLPELITAIVEVLPELINMIVNAIIENMPMLIDCVVMIITTLVQALPTIIQTLVVALPTILQTVWDGIVNVFNSLPQWFGQLFSGVLDAIATVLPEISGVWEGVKTKMGTTLNAIKNVVSTVWNAIKNTVQTVINAVKNVITTVWNNIKTIITNVMSGISALLKGDWNGVKNAISNIINAIKNTISSVWNGIKSVTSSVFNGIKSTVSSVWEGIKTAMTKPVESAKEKIKGIVDAVKGFFTGFKLEFPSIKLPHFSVKPSGWKVSDLLEGSIPSLGIEWYAKAMDKPLVMNNPTVFGYNPNTGKFMGGGEAGSEVVAGTGTLMGMIQNAVAGQVGGLTHYLQQVVIILADYFPQILNNMGHDIVLDTDALAVGLAQPINTQLGKLSTRKDRGR